MESAEILAGDLLDKQIQLRKLNSELEKQSEALKLQIELRNQLNQQVEETKAKLKEIAPLGKITKQLGDDELSVNIWQTMRVSEGNLADMPSEFITEEEIFNVVQRDGHFYQKHGNVALVKNLVQSGMDCPPGFDVKTNKAISIKFNGKAL